MTVTRDRRVRRKLAAPIAAAVVSVVAGLASFSDNLEKLFSAKLLLYLFAIGDFFKWELIGIAVILLTRSVLSAGFRHVVSGITYMAQRVRREPRYATHLLIVTFVLFTLIVIAAYNGSNYIIAKLRFAKHYEGTLATRAALAFADGRPTTARIYLRVGADVLNDSDFRAALTTFDARLADADALVAILAASPVTNPRRVDIINTIEALNHRKADATARRALEQERVLALKRDYEHGAEALRRGDYAMAQKHFRSVHKRFPWFGDVHRVLAELDAITHQPAAADDSIRSPYVFALRKNPDEVATLVRPLEQMVKAPDEPDAEGYQ